MNNVKVSVSIVIPSWNGLHLLKQSIDAMVDAAESYSGECEIIVVDNGSMDRTVDVLKDYYPDVRIIEFDHNTGFGHACNAGVQNAKHELILLLNNDIFIPNSLIQDLVNLFNKTDDCFSVSPRTNLWEDGRLTDKTFSTSINFEFNENAELIQQWNVNDFSCLIDEDCKTIYNTGAAMLVDKQKFLELGGFDSVYGLAYWEDADLCLRAWKKGWPSVVAINSVAWHQISASSESSFKDKLPTKTKMMTTNYIVFQLLHLPDFTHIYKFSRVIRRYMRHLKSSYDADSQKEISRKVFKLLPTIIKRRLAERRTSKLNTLIIANNIAVHKDAWKSSPVLEDEIKRDL
ncbi:MAG: glycosyltransferase family 2 protein [Lentilitoribacter sp.]